MAKRIVFIGAGSYTFTRNLCRDLLTFPAFQDAELVLMDISDENLDLARKMVTRIVEAGNYPARATTRAKARRWLSVSPSARTAA